MLAGCGKSIEEEALAAVSAKMFDPDAAMFRDVRQIGETTFCGEVNGKNRYGAYVGFTPFYAMKVVESWMVLTDSGETDVATHMCNGR
ncbi:hypothetical protein [Thauera sinica]|uniref:Lipoprotein n=1 Tax=Thauera sinica TaxID=2665146 RepID=A0ABW1ARJ8_9RHOO|nr:hypothetical protein [Thauera sp. K11]